MDLLTYSLLKKEIESVVSGVSSASVDGTSLTFTFTDGTTKTITFPTPSDGKSLDYDWDGTKLGIKIDGESEYTYVDLKGADGENGTDGKDGKSIQSITKDSSNNIIVTFSDGSTQNIGKLAIDVQSDFLTEDGFGNLRYYNGHFQYYNADSSLWIDTSATPDNIVLMNLTPKPMKSISVLYNRNTNRFEIKFTEPDDTYVDGQLLCAIEKIILVRKKDSEPQSVDDGTKILELKRNDFGLYKTNSYIDETVTPVIDDVYYYKAFPVSTLGYINDFSENSKMIVVNNAIVYGFKIDQNESDPSSMITYLEDCENANFDSAYMDYSNDTFNYGDWANAWFIKNLKPCMLKYDGTVDYELDKNDYSKKVDGTSSDIENESYEGNAMIGIPKVYWKIVDNGDNTANVYISDNKIDEDFKCWSHIDANGNEIDYCYMPIYNGVLVDGKTRSLSEHTPTCSQSGTNEINYAKSNNQTSDIIWYTEVFSDRILINLLLLLIGKSTDSQAIFGNGYYTSGTGVMKTGTMDTKGLFWGANSNSYGVKVFGIEHYYGNRWRRVAGCVNDSSTQKVKLTYGQQDGSTVNGYNTDGTGYITISNSTIEGSSGGYINKMIFGDFGMLPVKCSGSSTTYYNDILRYSNSQTYAIVGGSTYDGSGMFFTSLEADISLAVFSISISLSCKPLATTS